MNNKRILRVLETPTDIVILGTGFYWLKDTVDISRKEFIESLAPYQGLITDDEVSVSFLKKDIETDGYVTVVTKSEFEQIVEYGLLQLIPNSYVEVVVIDQYEGEVSYGVRNCSNGKNNFLELEENEDEYILYSVVSSEDEDDEDELEVEVILSNPNIKSHHIYLYMDEVDELEFNINSMWEANGK